MSIEWRVAVDDEETTAIAERAENERAVFVCAHGAGGHMRDRSMESVMRTLLGVGMTTVRFNFLYREKRSGRPDPMPRLKQCMTAVIGRAREALAARTLIIGGRSMGGRAASMLAAEGFACDGLLLLAYPLHPAGQPDKRRDAHLSRIGVPVLSLSGTRDPLCRQDLMEKVIASMGRNWTMHWLEGADHSFHVLKRSGRTDAQVMEELGQVSAKWLRSMGRATT